MNLEEIRRVRIYSKRFAGRTFECGMHQIFVRNKICVKMNAVVIVLQTTSGIQGRILDLLSKLMNKSFLCMGFVSSSGSSIRDRDPRTQSKRTFR